MDFLARFFDYITDNTRRLTNKAATVFISMIILFLVDNTLGFSYFYNLNNKMSVLEKVNKSIIDSSISQNEKQILIKLRTNVIQHKSMKDTIWDFIMEPNLLPSHSNYNSFIQFITSSFIWLILMFVVFFIGLRSLWESFKIQEKVVRNSPFEIIIKIIGTEFLFYVVSLLEAKFLSRVPALFNNIIYNYCFNFIFNVIGFIVVAFIINQYDKKNKHKLK